MTLARVTHKDLLLNAPVRLPLVNVDIALFGFFRYATLILLLVHMGLLLQRVMLARKFRDFTELIEPWERREGAVHAARELVNSYVVSQGFAGPRRPLILDWLTWFMVFVTFNLLPLVLPYHDLGTTWWHRNNDNSVIRCRHDV